MNAKIILTLIALLLAGCAETPVEPKAGLGEPAAGTGGISGLFVDDAFRPINGAVVTLNELNLDSASNENGEFGFTDIPPGQYTFNATVAGHSDWTGHATVLAGEITSVTWQTQRSLSTGGQVAQQEFVLFVDCEMSVFVANQECSSQPSMKTLELSYASEHPDSIVIEASFSSSGAHRVWATQGDYVASVEVNGTETGFILTDNTTSSETRFGSNVAFSSSEPLQFYWQPVGLAATGDSQGIGPHIAVTADITVTLLTGGLDPEDYCTSC